MPDISDSSVRKATGKTWDELFPVLDAAGARTLTHAEIVAVVERELGVGPWWRQMVTVEYERSRGLRARHQSAKGFSGTASRTIAAPVGRVYSAWATLAARRKWLDDPELTVRTSTKNKSMRVTWGDGTNVDVGFLDKGEQKSQVAVQHSRLKSAAAVARAKKYWTRQLVELKALLEGGARAGTHTTTD